MKIEEAKNIVAVKHGYVDWDDIKQSNEAGFLSDDFNFEMALNEAALLHTKHHVEQALKAASEKAKANTPVWAISQKDVDSILNAYPIENIQ